MTSKNKKTQNTGSSNPGWWHTGISLPPLFNPVKQERKGSCHNHHLHIFEWKVEEMSHFSFTYSKKLLQLSKMGESLTTIWEIVIFKVNYSDIHRWLPTTGNSLESFMRKTIRLCTDYFLVYKQLRGGTTCIL